MKILFTDFQGFNNTSEAIIDVVNNSYKEIDNQLANINITIT